MEMQSSTSEAAGGEPHDGNRRAVGAAERLQVESSAEHFAVAAHAVGVDALDEAEAERYRADACGGC